MFKLRTPTRDDWEEKANKLLAGRTITEIRYMTQEEVDAFGWRHAALILLLDDYSTLLIMADDEGNDAGAVVHCGPSLGGAVPVETTLPRL